MHKMINKYKNANKDLKQYKVSRVKSAIASNGRPFTVFNIADAKQVNGQWVYDNYSVFSWQPELKLKDDDKIEFVDIEAFEVKKETYNGQEIIKKTIFADVRVVGAQPTTQKVEMVDMPMTEISDDDLPF